MEKITTPEEAMKAVRNHAVAFLGVPNKLKTVEICLEAVKKDGYALAFVPDELKAQVEAELGKMKTNVIGR